MPAKKLTDQGRSEISQNFEKREKNCIEKELYLTTSYQAGLKAVDAKLSANAYRLWIYLSINFPFGDCEQELPSQSELGIRLSISRQAINSAAAEIQNAGLWDFYVERWKGRNLQGYNKRAKENRQVSSRTDRCQANLTPGQANLTPGQANLTPGQANLTPQEPKALQGKDFSAPHTIQTYSDLIKSLSESERENFLEFGRNKAKRLPHPPELPDKWVANNWKELRSQWEASAVGCQVRDEATTADWLNHPDFDEWLNKCYFVGRLWTMEDCPDQAERTAFFAWAQKTNAYVGRIDGAT